MTTTIWYTRCPVPTASGIAFRLGLFDKVFAGTHYRVRNIKELERSGWDTHFSHSQDASFREGGGSPPVWAHAAGAPTRLLGITFMDEVLGLYVRADDPADSVAALAGRRFALPVWPKLVFNFYRFAAEKGFFSALRVHGMRESDVEFVDVVEADDPHEFINPDPAVIAARAGRSYYHAQMQALIDGRVDVIFAKGGETATLERAAGGAIRRIYDLCGAPRMEDRVNNSTPRLLTVSESLARHHPEAVARYVGALIEAAHWASQHTVQAQHILAEELSITPQDICARFGSDFHEKLLPRLDPPMFAALDVMKGFLHARGYIERDFSGPDWAEPGLLEAAYASTRRLDEKPARLGAGVAAAPP